MSSAKVAALFDTWSGSVETVTPETAATWLRENANPKNRPVRASDARVQAYAREMKLGRWMVSPLSALGFDTHGMLLNGHHRLHAVQLANVSCRFVVFRNVPTEVNKVVDTEKPRTNVQIGRMFDEDVSLDAALKVVALIRLGHQGDYIGPSDLESYRREFASISDEDREHLRSIRVAGRPLRAGVVAGFLLLLADPRYASSAASMLLDLANVAARTSLGSQATRNLVKWIETVTGTHARLALEGAAAVVAAHRQFANRETKEFIKPMVENLRPFARQAVE